MSYQVGRGTMLEGLDEALEGMSAGDEKTFESTLVGGEFKDQSRRRHRQGHRGQGAGAARRSTTSSPRPRRSSTRSTS